MYSGVLVLLLLSGCPESAAQQKEAEATVYASPNAVFDAYRHAYNNQDWRSLYFLCTRELQQELVFEAAFKCYEVGDADSATRRIEEKFGASEADLTKKYYESYKRKHGHGDVIDKYLAKAIPHLEAKAGSGVETDESQFSEEAAAVKALPADKELQIQAVYDATKDKVGYFAAVQEMVQSGRKPNVIGDLKELVVDGDTATGHATILKRPGPRESKQTDSTYDKRFKFRQLNGGWLVDLPYSSRDRGGAP
ncbi:MAG: hypothetical protein DWQ37_01275 [Planctomycetota bacterium]|nr:MAG: hypothetical protein DWQ37_01275 [Planctomycetota bacterium]